MRYFMVVVIYLTILSGCSKSPENTNPNKSESLVTEEKNTSTNITQSDNTSFIKSIKKDFAALFVAEVSEECVRAKGDEMPVPKSGSAIQYAADGQISWGASSFNYVEESGGLSFENNQSAHIFVFNTDIFHNETNNRDYGAGLSQLKGNYLDAIASEYSGTNNADANLPTTNACIGRTPPALVTQGAWSLAAKHVQVSKTIMSCTSLGKFETTDIAFSFNGKLIEAGNNNFTETDSHNSEVFIIQPTNEDAKISYSVQRADGVRVLLGLSAPNNLTHAELKLADGTQQMCTIK